MKRSSTGSSKFHVESPTSCKFLYYVLLIRILCLPAATLTIPGSAPSIRRRSGTPGGASIDDTFLANMIFDTPNKSANTSSSLQKSPHHKSTSALNDVTAPAPHTASHPHTSHPHSAAFPNPSFASEFESPSYLANLTSGFADEFDSSPNASIVSGQSNVFSKSGSRHSNQALRDFDLTEDILQHFSMNETPVHRHANPKPAYNSPVKDVDIPATSSPVTRYKRSSSPAMIITDRTRYRSTSPLEEAAHSYHPPSHLHRPPPPPTHQARQPPPVQKLLYDNEAGMKHNGPTPPPTQGGSRIPVPVGGSGSRIPVPVGARPSNPESYDLHEMLKVWENSNKNPFGEGTLV